MNNHILEKEVQAYIEARRNHSASEMALKKSPFDLVNSSEIASQIDGWQRAVKKLPTWAATKNIYFPDKINLEQCSSERTAFLKQKLIQKESKVVDITGGFGIDSHYFAQEAASVIHCERNEKLSAIVKYNATVLHTPNLKAIATDGVKFVQDQADDSIDYIFIDPSRRVNHAKVFLLEDCEPNIVELQQLFFQKAKHILIKLSPLLDISTALLKLNHVKSVFVVSVDGDCKELLFLQERNFHGEADITVIRIQGAMQQQITFTNTGEKNTEITTSVPLKYLYDPDVALSKSGAFKITAKLFKLFKLNINTHLYTSNDVDNNFLGRIFKVENVFSINEFKKLNTFAKANVATKNFPMKVDEIRKKYKLKDGGSDFLYFTTEPSGNHIVIHCTKI